MPRIKLTEEDKADIIKRAEDGEKLSELAEEFDISVRYVRKLFAPLREEAEEKRETLAARISIDTAACLNCTARAHEWSRRTGIPLSSSSGPATGFKRYEGEQDKNLCSLECYEEYATRDFPPKDAALYPGKACNNGSREFQQSRLKKNARFFPEVDFVDETEEPLPDYLIA